VPGGIDRTHRLLFYWCGYLRVVVVVGKIFAVEPKTSGVVRIIAFAHSGL
jgi:hypothetical protein